MKNIKKFFTVALISVFLFSASACQQTAPKTEEPLDTAQIYQDALDKSSKLNAIEMDMEISMNMKQGEETLSLSSNMNLKVTGYGTDSMESATDTHTNLSGQEISISGYYKDGYYYSHVAGQKTKYTYDLDAIQKQLGDSLGFSSLPSEAMKSMKAKQEGDKILISFEADPSKMNDYINSALGSLGDLASAANITLNQISGTFTVGPEGYVTASDISMDMISEVQGTSLQIHADTVSEITGVNDQVSISFPEDLDTYTEVDGNAITGQ